MNLVEYIEFTVKFFFGGQFVHYMFFKTSEPKEKKRTPIKGLEEILDKSE